MIGKSDSPPEPPPREKQRYTIPLPIEIEVKRGLFGGKLRITALPIDLAIGGAACLVKADPAFKVGKRFRIFIDGRSCFAEVRNVSTDGADIRVGLSFIQLELDTQELIVDAIDQEKIDRSRLT